MIEPEKFILTVLQGNLKDTLDNPVRLIQTPPQYNNIPCLTIDNSAGASIIEQSKHNLMVEDEPREVIETRYDIDIRLDIWVLNEEDRQFLIEQVQDCFMKALGDNYQYCTSYLSGECDCLVTDPEYQYDKRVSKQQCPEPRVYPYENLWTHYNIDLETFQLSLPYNLDELEETEAILRTRFDISFDWTDYYVLGGITSESLTNGGI